jgi:hypothetical protein
MRDVEIPVSVGELVDKITILRIKARLIADPAKVANVRAELEALERVAGRAGLDLGAPDVAELERINAALWRIEDDIREKERTKTFDQAFIELARQVYLTNDQRFAVKARLNQRSGSRLREEKSYKEYR